MLLETVPGIRFRSEMRSGHKDHGRKAALTSFRRLVDCCCGHSRSVFEVFQDWNLNFDGLRSIDVIPFNEFEPIDGFVPEQGFYGMVQRAIWKCPQKAGMRAPENRDVALKTMKLSDAKHLELFLREVSPWLISCTYSWQLMIQFL
jgi:hypothetical protein